MSSVDLEITCVNIVSLHYHFKNFRLMDGTLFHEVNGFVLDGDGLVHVVFELDLQLVLELAVLLEEDLLFDGVRELFVVLGEQVHFAVVHPVVVLVAHGVLSPDAAVLAAAQQEELVDFLVQVLPVEHVGQPGEAVREVEEAERELPRHAEGVHEEEVPRDGNRAVEQAVGVLEVHSRVLDVVARVEQQFALAVEGERRARLVHLVGQLEVLFRTLRQLSLVRVDDLVQVVDLPESTRLRAQQAQALRSAKCLCEHFLIIITKLNPRQT